MIEMKMKAKPIMVSLVLLFCLSFYYCLTQKEIIRSVWAAMAGDVDVHTQQKIDAFDDSIQPLPSFGELFNRILNPSGSSGKGM